MKPWVLFCEGPSDARTAQLLIDETLSIRCATWVRELLEHSPESVREWHRDPVEDRAWFDLHHVYSLADTLGVKRAYGHFAGGPSAPGALLLNTILRIVRRWREHEQLLLEAVVVMWDMDQQGHERRRGFEQAQAAEIRLAPAGVAVVVACPDPMREAWVLAGLEPESQSETLRLAQLRQQLGFHPTEEPHRCEVGNDQAPRHAKKGTAVHPR